MKFEIIRDTRDMEMYGDVPCLPVEYDATQGERFIGEEADSWLLLDDFVPQLDGLCQNDLDYGDVDYFDADKCRILKDWLIERKNRILTARLQVLYQILEGYVDEALEIGTGVVIEL